MGKKIELPTNMYRLYISKLVAVIHFIGHFRPESMLKTSLLAR